MTEARLIIGDWGNSNARLWLSDAGGTVLAERRGPGIAALRGDADAIAAAFAAMTREWPAAVPALLAGVVGASFGWRDAGYLACPIGAAQIGGHPVRAPTNGRPIWIAPGLSCINGWGEPDTMRGEELQIAGWLMMAAGEGDALVALPGTHCKWAVVQGGKVIRFHSSISGELFALLRQHSVMVDPAVIDAPHDPAAFAEGAALAAAAPAVDMAALLFAARARQAVGAMDPAAAPSFLSGIIIGCDCRTALAQAPAKRVVLIGEAMLVDHYAAALAQTDCTLTRVDGEVVMRAGLMAAARAVGLG